MPRGLTKRQQAIWKLAAKPVKRRRKLTERRVKELISNADEAKYIDTPITEDGAYAANSTVHCLTLSAQGDAVNQRNGNTIKLQSIQIQGRIQQDADSARSTMCRILLVEAKDCDGALIDVTNVLTQDLPFQSLRNYLYMNDYKVHFDSQFILELTAITANNDQNKRVFKYYKKFKKPIHTTYDDTTAVIASAERNHLFLIFMCDATVGIAPQFSLLTRVVYKEV